MYLPPPPPPFFLFVFTYLFACFLNDELEFDDRDERALPLLSELDENLSSSSSLDSMSATAEPYRPIIGESIKCVLLLVPPASLASLLFCCPFLDFAAVVLACLVVAE